MFTRSNGPGWRMGDKLYPHNPYTHDLARTPIHPTSPPSNYRYVRLPFTPGAITTPKGLPMTPNEYAGLLYSEGVRGSFPGSPAQMPRYSGANFHSQVVARLEQIQATRSLPNRVLARLSAVGSRIAPSIARVATNPWLLGAVGLAALGAVAYYWWTSRDESAKKVVEEQADIAGVPASSIYEFAKMKTPHYHPARPDLPYGAMPGEAIFNKNQFLFSSNPRVIAPKTGRDLGSSRMGNTRMVAWPATCD